MSTDHAPAPASEEEELDSLGQAYRALAENRAMLAGLTLVLALLVVRLLRAWLRPASPQPAPAANQSRPAAAPVDDAVDNDVALAKAFAAGAKPPQDSVHSLMGDGDYKVPTMCPFFQAFKAAAKRAEKEKEEEANIARTLERRGAGDKSAPALFMEDKSAPALFMEDKSAHALFEDDKSASALSVDPAVERTIESVPFTHLPGSLKRREQAKLFGTLSAEERRVEQEAVSGQLRQIFGILAAQQDTEAAASLEEIRSQMKLYT